VPKQPIALLVMEKERRTILLDHLNSIDADIVTASSCAEAADRLRADPGVRLVLTDLTLPDGSWFDVLSRVDDAKADAKVVVCARLADERLWSQVLEAGAYDMLVEPYQQDEVRRILDAAAAPVQRSVAAS